MISEKSPFPWLYNILSGFWCHDRPRAVSDKTGQDGMEQDTTENKLVVAVVFKCFGSSFGLESESSWECGVFLVSWGRFKDAWSAPVIPSIRFRMCLVVLGWSCRLLVWGYFMLLLWNAVDYSSLGYLLLAWQWFMEDCSTTRNVLQIR